MSSHTPLGRLINMFATPRTLYNHTQRLRLFVSSRRAFSCSAAAGEAPAVLLVESPAKAKKIQEYLGPNYRVLASYGHIRDLPAKTGSVNPEQGFEMRWELSDSSRPRVAEIAEAVRAAPRVFLATDPDREGEAISWHLVEELKHRGALSANILPERITFTEVTKPAVEAAIAAPREVSIPLVEAYMARRALDYLFGFNLSPLLWRKLPGARSAGRVQSVALRLVADREAAIEAFIPQQYWTLHAQVDVTDGDGRVGSVQAALTKVDGATPPSPGFLNQEEAQRIQKRIESSNFSVASVGKKEISRNPPPPFTTSTLQQEASRRLGWGAARTMQFAQKLYEGGYITYMRTDGVNVAPQAVQSLRSAVEDAHGSAYLPSEPRYYSSKSKNAQEAHEAIRPTNPNLQPSTLLAMGMEATEVQLYSLVRSRAMASQMASTKVESVGADFASEDGSLTLRATASYTLFPGYLAAYGMSNSAAAGGGRLNREEGDETSDGIAEAAARGKGFFAGEEAAEALGRLAQGQDGAVHNPEASEHETRPPGRFTEGTLVKALEEAGVGRPSTYAPTLKLLQARRYVRKEGRALHAEPLGRVLSAFLCRYFATYVDPEFTSRMEDNLDEVSAGREGWKDLLEQFWEPFHGRVAELGSLTGTEVIDVLNEELEVLLFGRPLASNKENLEQNQVVDGQEESQAVKDSTAELQPGRICPSCSSPLSLKLSHRGGAFIGCTSYPTCSYARPVLAPPDLAPSEGEGEDASGFPIESGMALAEKYGMRGSVRVLGEDSRGKVIFVRQGPYGPYVQLGIDSDVEMRRAPLPKTLNARAVKLDYAFSLLALPRELGNHPEDAVPVIVRNGKFGPYVVHGSHMRSIPKDLDPLVITLDEAVHLLEPRERGNKGKSAAVSAKPKGENTDQMNKTKRGRPKKLTKGLEWEESGTKGAGEGDESVPKKRGRPKKILEVADGATSARFAETGSKVRRARSSFMFYVQGKDKNHAY